jgi:hypothetical protein
MGATRGTLLACFILGVSQGSNMEFQKIISDQESFYLQEALNHSIFQRFGRIEKCSDGTTPDLVEVYMTYENLEIIKFSLTTFKQTIDVHLKIYGDLEKSLGKFKVPAVKEVTCGNGDTFKISHTQFIEISLPDREDFLMNLATAEILFYFHLMKEHCQPMFPKHQRKFLPLRFTAYPNFFSLLAKKNSEFLGFSSNVDLLKFALKEVGDDEVVGPFFPNPPRLTYEGTQVSYTCCLDDRRMNDCLILSWKQSPLKESIDLKVISLMSRSIGNVEFVLDSYHISLDPEILENCDQAYSMIGRDWRIMEFLYTYSFIS